MKFLLTLFVTMYFSHAIAADELPERSIPAKRPASSSIGEINTPPAKRPASYWYTNQQTTAGDNLPLERRIPAKRPASSSIDEINAPPAKRPARYWYTETEDKEPIARLRPAFRSRTSVHNTENQKRDLQITDLPFEVLCRIFEYVSYDHYLTARSAHSFFAGLIESPHFLSIYIPETPATSQFWNSYHHDEIALRAFFSMKDPWEIISAPNVMPEMPMSNLNLAVLFSYMNNHTLVVPNENIIYQMFPFLVNSVNPSHTRYSPIRPFGQSNYTGSFHIPIKKAIDQRLNSLIPYAHRLPSTNISRPLAIHLASFPEHDIERITRYIKTLKLPISYELIDRLRSETDISILRYNNIFTLLRPNIDAENTAYRIFYTGLDRTILRIFNLDIPLAEAYFPVIKKLYTPKMSLEERIAILEASLPVDYTHLKPRVDAIKEKQGFLFPRNYDRSEIIEILLKLDPIRIDAIGNFMKKLINLKKQANPSAKEEIIGVLSQMEFESINLATQHFSTLIASHLKHLDTLPNRSATKVRTIREAIGELPPLLEALSRMPLLNMEIFLRSNPFPVDMRMSDRITVTDQNIQNNVNYEMEY